MKQYVSQSVFALIATWATVAPAAGQSVAAVHGQVHQFVASADTAAVQSGDWSDPQTWGGVVPGTRAKVAIPAGITVTVDREIAMAYDWIRVDGTLRFQPDVNTQLTVETVVAMGRIEIGTAAAPIQPDVTARLVFASPGQPISHTLDPLELTRGLIAMGPMSIVGSAKQEISALVGFPGAGATTLRLGRDPIGWRVGDEVLVTPTLWGQDEVVTVQAINGRDIQISPALKFTRMNVPNDPAIRVHVGNLTRNAIVQTDPSQAGNPELQGHVMLMGGGHRIQFAAFLDTGRTLIRPVTDPIILPDGTRDPSLMPLCGIADENVRGRYALHFHNPGPSSEPSLVEGTVIRVQRNKGFKIGLQNHSAYVIARRNIVHQIDGSGLFGEEGDERGEFTGNLVVHSLGSNVPKAPFPQNEPCAKMNYPDVWNRRRVDLGHRGAGIWVQGSGNVTVSGNILAGHAHAGIDIKAQRLDARKKNSFTVLVRPDHLRDGYGWVTAKLGNIDPTKPILPVTMPPFLITDNQIYAIGNNARYGRKAAINSDSMGLQMAEWPARPKSLFARNLAWNVAMCVFAEYSDWGRLEDLTCIGGFLPPGSRQANYPSSHTGITTRAQNGQYWEYDNVRIEGFGAEYEFVPSPGSTFRNVTINGKPYSPTIEACGDGVDNDLNGLTEETCLLP